MGLIQPAFFFSIVHWLQVFIFAFDIEMSDQVWIAILILPLIFFTWIRNLDTLAIFSTIANLCIVFSLIVIFYEEVYRFTTDYPPEKAAIKTESLYLLPTLVSLPLFFGTAVYAYEGIGAVSVGNSLIGWGIWDGRGIGMEEGHMGWEGHRDGGGAYGMEEGHMGWRRGIWDGGGA